MGAEIEGWGAEKKRLERYKERREITFSVMTDNVTLDGNLSMCLLFSKYTCDSTSLTSWIV